jgi:hypothetical protein
MTCIAVKYETVNVVSLEEAATLVDGGDYDASARAVVSLALYGSDPAKIAPILARAAKSPNALLRGNALLGFGHIARRFGSLDRTLVEPLVQAALTDAESYVRGHAHSAAEDFLKFLGWSVAGAQAVDTTWTTSE